MKLVYSSQLWRGSTSLQRLEAFQRLPDITAVACETGAEIGNRPSLWQRVRWKLGWPSDSLGENQRLIACVEAERPDVVLVDNSRVLRRATIANLRLLGVRTVAYYTPDDIVGHHNMSRPLRISLRDWDLFFTTKTFNVQELRAMGVRAPVLIGKAFDAALHRPMDRNEVGEEFERYDLVFAGAYERERCASINALTEAGLSVVVYGSGVGGWHRSHLAGSTELRPAIFDTGYRCVMHHGKIALGFLRKLNRDRITQRTMEIAAMGRPMLAERTDEHSAHFVDGAEYIGFTSDAELVARARELLADDARRQAVAAAARRRCLGSGYSTDARAAQMIDAIRTAQELSRNTVRL